MPDIVDELQLKIESSVKNVDDIKKLASGLRSMAKSVEKLQGTGGTINQFVGSITRLSRLKVDGDASGIKAMTNSLVRLSKASQNMNTSSLKSFARVAKSLTSAFSHTSKDTQNATRLLNSIASVSKNSGNMEEAATNLPLIADGIKELGEAIDKMPLSDKALQVMDSVGSLAKYSGNLASTYQQLGTSSKSIDLLKISLKSLGDTLKFMGGGAVNGVKRLASAIGNLGRHRSSVGGLAYNIKMLLGTVIGFRGITGIFNWTKDAVSAGAEIAEVNHIVESVFGAESLQKVDDWSHNLIENFGIAEIAGKKYAGTLSAMFQSSGVSMENAGDMSMKLVELAGDLSSFYNIDTETAYNKIKSGMVGMVRPLRDLGIDLTATTLKQYALSQGIEKSYTDMTQAEKIMLRYQYLLSVTGQQQGDFANTSQTLANSLRTLRAYAAAVTAQIGEGLGAAIRHVIHGLNYMMKYVLKAAQAFSILMQTIFGKNVGSASGVSLDSSMDDIADDASDLADSAGEASDGLGGAADNAEKLRKELSVLPFDELNQLNKDTEKTSSSSGKGGKVGGVGGGGVGDFGDGIFGSAINNTKGKLGELESYVSEWGKRIRTAFENKDWKGLGEAIASGFNDGIHKLYQLLDPTKAEKAVNGFIDPFVTTFNSFVNAIHWTELGETIGNGITILVNAFNRLLDPKTGIDFENIGTSLGTALNGAIRKINWTGVGNLISNRFMVGWRVFHGFIKRFNAEDAGNALGAAIGGAIEKFDPVLIGDALGTAVTKIATVIKNGFGKKETWEELGTKLGQGINAFLDSFDGEEVADGINAMLSAITTTIGKMLDTIDKKQLITDIGDFIANLDWATIATFASIIFIPKLITGIGGYLIKDMVAKHTLTSALSTVLGGATTEAVASETVTAAASTGATTFLGTIGSSLITAAPILIPAALAIAGVLGMIWGDTPEVAENKRKFQEDIKNNLNGVENAFYGTGYSVQQYNKDVNDEMERQYKESLDFIVNSVLPAYKRENQLTQEDYQKLVSAIMQGDAEMTTAVETWAREHCGYTGDIMQANSELSSTSSEASSGVTGSLGEIDTKSGEVKDAVVEDLRSMDGEMKDLHQKSGTYASGINENSKTISGSFDSMTLAVNTKMPEATSTITSNTETMNTALGGVAETAAETGDSVPEEMADGINDNAYLAEGAAEDLADSMMEAFSEKFDAASMIDDAFADIDSICNTLEGYGQSMGQAIADGISNIDIPVPNIYESGGTYHSVETADSVITYYIPSYSIEWYAQGGLFTKATIAGFGEAGDEAALPLTDKAVMSRIAGAITDNMNKDAIGISKDDIMEAVARGYVQAMMNNQGNERPIDVYATLYTEDNEVLARAVQRGNRSMDFRNNATTSFG